MNSKKAIEAVILGGSLVVSLQAFAATDACTNGSAVSGGVTSAGFVKNSFNPKCSANVTVSVNDLTSSFTVQSASQKGKTYFGGSTEGGTVAACSTFTSYAAPTAGATNGCS